MGPRSTYLEPDDGDPIPKSSDGELRRPARTGPALAVVTGSTLLWGLAHLWTGRRATGAVLMAAYAVLVTAVALLATELRPQLLALVVNPGRFAALIGVAAMVGLTWSLVVFWSYRLVRPGRGRGRAAVRTLTCVLCVAVLVPPLYAARLAQVSHEVVATVFASSGVHTESDDPWKGKPWVSVLLLGADAARSRPGARTDSMTVAEIDTRTGRTVLFSLPRNLQRVPMPKGPARRLFPYGFTGDGAGTTPGLLNEIYQWGEDHPWMMPGLPERRRGAALLKQTIAGILGIPVDHYVMVDMRGFKEIIDAIGGVTVTVRHDIPYGLEGGILRAGTRRLSGEEALWFGRSRSDSDDYARMGRQRCLLDAVVRQADPVTVLRSFGRLADAAKRYVFTDIPGESLPAFVDLSRKMKNIPMESVQFVPPLINTAYPDWQLIKQKVSTSIGLPASPDPTGTPPEHATEDRTGSQTSPAPRQSTLNASCN